MGAKRSTTWAKRLSEVFAAVNNEVPWLSCKKAVAAVKDKAAAKPSTPFLRPLGVKEKKLPSSVNVRFLFHIGELKGGAKRPTDPIWYLNVFSIERPLTKPVEPVL